MACMIMNHVDTGANMLPVTVPAEGSVCDCGAYRVHYDGGTGAKYWAITTNGQLMGR
jgi:hypothetical protein